MSIGAILIGATLIVIIAPLVARPLSKARRTGLSVANPESLLPAQQRREFLLALRDLEFDHHTGKVNEEDYQALRGSLLLQAATATELAEQQDDGLDARVEAAIQAHRRSRADDRFCGQCGNEIRSGDRFCRACGRPVLAAAAT